MKKLFPIAQALVTAPTIEPLTVTEVKAHCRIEHTEDDAVNIPRWIAASRIEAEKLQGKKYITQTWDLVFSAFPVNGPGAGGWVSGSSIQNSEWLNFFRTAPLQIPIGPIQSVESITYIDSAGVSQTFGTYAGSPLVPVEWTLLRNDVGLSRIILNLNQFWPVTAPVENAVTVRVVVGYGDAAVDVPQLSIAAMLLLCGHFSENREAVSVSSDGRVQAVEIPLGIRDLIAVPKVG